MTVKDELLLSADGWIPFSFKSKDISFKSNRSGVGDGEEKVIAELCARHDKTGGYSSTFDLLIDNGELAGTKWEVKKILKKNDEVRSGRDGKRAAGDLIDVIRGYIIEAITDFNMKSLSGINVDGKDFDAQVILHMLQDMKASLNIGEFSSGAFYGKKIVPRSKHELGLLQIVEATQNSSACLLEISWENLALPSRAFEEVDGLILVNPDDGFVMIPRCHLNEYLTFNRISLGTAKYSVNRK